MPKFVLWILLWESIGAIGIMINDFEFDQSILDTVIGGLSALDIPRLRIRNLDQAYHFLKGYGYDWNDQEHVERLWYFHRRASLLLVEVLLNEDEHPPQHLLDRNKLNDLRYLLLYASDMSPENKELQKWSCAILRVMHVFAHIESDLFNVYAEEIQSQILEPFQSAVFSEPGSTGFVLRSNDDEVIRLHRFEVKPFKTTNSSVIKLLAKSNIVAMRIFDKLGVRFITKNQFDSFRLIRFLTDKGIVSFPHIVPDQSVNTLYPVNLFFEVVREVAAQTQSLEPSQIDELFQEKLEKAKERAAYTTKVNKFTSEDYRFIKFISRKLVRIKPEGGTKSLQFFYPYEVQIIDYQAHLNHLSGPSSHEAYKERQRRAARIRVLGETPTEQGESVQ